MKLLLVSLLLGGLPPWISHAIASPKDDEAVAQSQVIVLTLGDAEGATEVRTIVKCRKGRSGAPCVISTSGAAPCIMAMGDGAAAYAYALAIGDGHGKRHMIRVGDKKDAENRAWLGVSIGTVPKALAAQLDIAVSGIMVLNVVEGSPADRAGIEAYDIILSVDADDIEGEIGSAVDLIKSRQPGEEVEVVVLRKGREKTLSVELGSRADMKGLNFTWKFKGAPLAELEEQIHTRARILRKRGEDDTWVVEELGDLKALKNLPMHIQMLLPKSGSRSVQVHINGGKKKIETKVERDGSTMTVIREGDGPITVTRVDEDGRETEVSYDDEEELLQGDEEAYDLWEKMSAQVVVNLDIDEIEIPEIDIEIPDIQFDIDMDVWKEHMEQWREQMEGEGEPGGFRFPPLPMFFGKDGRSEFPGFMARHHFGKPKHTFEIRTDGTIEVRIRRGHSELVRLFDDEDDLARRSPKLYRKYEKLMELDVEDEE